MSRFYAFRSALFGLSVFYANWLYFQLFRKFFRRVLPIFLFRSWTGPQRARPPRDHHHVQGLNVGWEQMAVPPTSTSTMFPSNPMPTPHINPILTPSAAPMPSTVAEPMNLDTIAKLWEELHAYIGERRNDRSKRQDNREFRRCYNGGEQGHLALGCHKNRPPSPGRGNRLSRSGTP